MDEDPDPSGLRIVGRVIESDPEERPGLAEALRWIAARRADVVLVPRLAAAARSLGELIRLLDWLESHRAALMALDVEMDTAQPSGRREVRLLREIHRWGREPERPRRPPGRPGLGSAAPELARQIAQLREQGLTLHAIAEALNTQRIPTPRGGARWRPSSVQSVLGYQRPRPPAPGAPPPAPPGCAVPPGAPGREIPRHRKPPGPR